MSVARTIAREGPLRGASRLQFGRLEVVDQTPPGDDGVARGRAEGPPAAARRRGRARSHRDPAISGGAAVGRRDRPGSPAALSDGRSTQRRCGPTAPAACRGSAGTRPACGRARSTAFRTGTHLDHFAPACAVCPVGAEAAPSSVTTGRPAPAQPACRRTFTARSRCWPDTAPPAAIRPAGLAHHEQLRVRVDRRRPQTAGIWPIGMCWAPARGRADHSSSSRTSSRTPTVEGRRNACATSTSSMPFMLTRRAVGAPLPQPPRGALTQCQQCRAIHNFHRFIHSPSAAATLFEPPICGLAGNYCG